MIKKIVLTSLWWIFKLKTQVQLKLKQQQLLKWICIN